MLTSSVVAINCKKTINEGAPSVHRHFGPKTLCTNTFGTSVKTLQHSGQDSGTVPKYPLCHTRQRKKRREEAG